MVCWEDLCVTSLFPSPDPTPLKGSGLHHHRHGSGMVSTPPTGLSSSSALLPLTVPSAVDEVVDRLLTSLALGRSFPGERLPAERAVARRLEVSRNTVRETFARLRASEVIEVGRGRTGGAHVCQRCLPGPSGRSSPEVSRRSTDGLFGGRAVAHHRPRDSLGFRT